MLYKYFDAKSKKGLSLFFERCITWNRFYYFKNNSYLRESGTKEIQIHMTDEQRKHL
jgi:hypothetical protein